MDEFEIIEQILAPLAAHAQPALGLKSDTAHWQAPAGETMVVTIDLLVEGRHFQKGEDAGAVAQKLLRVNLSDLAASGAVPRGYLLALALPRAIERNWLIAFRDALAADQKEFGIELWGGDTVGAPTLTLSLTAIGTVPDGAALSRFGARSGCDLYVSGTIGDAALGLACLEGDLPEQAYLIDRLRQPQPRLALGEALRGLAAATVDISDGLIGDVERLCDASGVGAEIETARVPLSEAARRIVSESPKYWSAILAGGDDYELAFAMAKSRKGQVERISRRLELPLTRIGKIVGGSGVRVVDSAGEEVKLDKTGYRHAIGNASKDGKISS